MGQLRHDVIAHRCRHPFKGMGRTENIIQQGAIFWIVFQLQDMIIQLR